LAVQLANFFASTLNVPHANSSMHMQNHATYVANDRTAIISNQKTFYTTFIQHNSHIIETVFVLTHLHQQITCNRQYICPHSITQTKTAELQIHVPRQNKTVRHGSP
jgi:hypothetical protein